jgi:hypothetical protein
MSPDLTRDTILATGAAALLFAATFLVGGRVHPLRALMPDRRSALSLGAGMSAAYVFVHLMPELHESRSAFAASVSVRLRYEGMAIYYVALVGFLVFYALDELRARLREDAEGGEVDAAFKLHIGGFAAYVCLMAYLLVHGLEETTASTAMYAVPIALHFLSVDHSLRSEHGAAYDRIGRPVLAAMSLVGWGVGLLVALPPYVLALLVAFISGAIIMNNSIMELPSEKDGRFVAFMVGGLVYGAILLPLG